MIAHAYSEARQQLVCLLNEGLCEGEARIRRRGGQVCVLRPQPRAGSPPEVGGVDLGVSTAK
jgi:hypothetical protein